MVTGSRSILGSVNLTALADVNRFQTRLYLNELKIHRSEKISLEDSSSNFWFFALVSRQFDICHCQLVPNWGNNLLNNRKHFPNCVPAFKCFSTLTGNFHQRIVLSNWVNIDGTSSGWTNFTIRKWLQFFVPMVRNMLRTDRTLSL